MTSKRIALAIWLTFWAIGAAWAFIGVPENGDLTGGDAIGVTLIYGIFVSVGALIVARVPRNSVGWILCAVGLGANLGNFLQQYVVYRDSLNAFDTQVAGWFGNWLWPISIVCLVFVLLLFPTGRPIDGWLGYLVPAAVIGVGLFAVAFMFLPGMLEIGVDMPNPLGIEVLEPVLSIAELVGAVSVPVAAFGGFVTLVVRARRANGIEAQQLKWFGYAAAIMVAGNFLVTPILESLFGEGKWSSYVFIFMLALIPLATGVAILRFHLYDIDVIINKTLVYAGISAILIGVYLAIVFGLQTLLDSVTSDSDLAVAASTLAVAAMFRPLRMRMQEFVDQRFYRRKYDAAITLGSLARWLRDEVELDVVRRDVLEVLNHTLQPAHASMWLHRKGG